MSIALKLLEKTTNLGVISESVNKFVDINRSVLKRKEVTQINSNINIYQSFDTYMIRINFFENIVQYRVQFGLSILVNFDQGGSAYFFALTRFQLSSSHL